VGLATPAHSQTYRDFDINGVNLRVEFWDPTDGAFSWNIYNVTPTHNFEQDQIDAISRGVQYWVDVLGPNNTPGRDMVFRIVRDTSIGPDATQRSIYANLGTLRTFPQYIWADGFTSSGATASDGQSLDTVVVLGNLPWSSAPTGQLYSGGVSLEAVIIHELAHALGLINFRPTWGNSGLLTSYEALLVDQDGNPVVAGASFSATTPIYFTGANAMGVYGDRVLTSMVSVGKKHLALDPLLITLEEFRNYPFLTELELAIMQDLGYDIDRSKFFGRSFYQDGNMGDPVIVNNNGFNSTATYGVGLHVKANQLNILQNVDLISEGAGGAGIRIDGRNNLVTIGQNVNIAANGDFGAGVVVSNGTGNVLVHRGSIEAGSTTTDQEGTGILIGFGPNGIAFGQNRTSASLGFRDYLVDRLDISGSISAGGNAIVIDSTAAVREINIMAGAQITGNIVSDALVNESLSLYRPTITFGYEADADGAKTTTADLDFNIQYSGTIGGLTWMDAHFVGGIDHQTGALLEGAVGFNSVHIHDTGRLTANGTFVVTDGIDVHGAMNSVGGQIVAPGGIQIHNGARFSGTPAIFSTLVNNMPGGTIAPGNSIGTMAVVGDFQSNGNVEFEISHLPLAQDTDRIVVSGGTVFINNATTYADRGTFEFIGETSTSAADYAIGRRYAIIVTDNPGNLVVVQRPKAVDNIDGRRIILRSNTDVNGFYTPGAQIYYAYIGRDVPYASLATTPSQQTLAAYFDSLFASDDGSALSDQIQWFRDTLDLMPDENQVLALLNALSGEMYASVNPMILQELYRSQNQLAARLRSDETRLGVCDEQGNRVSLGWTGWVTGFGTGGRTHGNSIVQGYDVSTGGTQAVAAYGIDCNTLVGGFYDYAGISFRQRPSSAQVDANEWGMFLTHHADLLYFTVLGSGGTAAYEVRRGVVFGNTAIQLPVQEMFRSNFDGSFASVYSEVGLKHSWEWFTVRPFWGLGYTHLNTEGHAEDGGFLSLAVKESSIDSLRSMLGLDLSVLLSQQRGVSVDFRSMWMHDLLFGGVQHVRTGISALGDGSLVVAGADIGRDFGVLGAGLSLDIVPKRLRVSGGYDLIINRYQTLNTGTGTVELVW